MVDEHKLLRDTDRALKAKQLLENDLFNEAFVSIKAELLKAWEDSNPRDNDGRERCWAAVQAIGNVRGYFENMVNDGKLAQTQLNALHGA